MVERRSSRKSGRDSGRGSRSRRPAKKSSSNPALIFGGLAGVIALGVAAFFIFGGGDEAQSDDKKLSANAKKEQAALREPAGSEESLFSASTGSGNKNAESKNNAATPENSEAQKIVKQEPKEPVRERVVGREPKSIPALAELLEIKNRLYVSTEIRAKIEATNREALKFRTERWDVTKKMIRAAEALKKQARKDKRDPFLSEADTLFKRLNTRMTKSDLHKKDSSGNLFDEPFIGYIDEPYAIYVQQSQDVDEIAFAKKTVAELKALRTAFVDFFGGFIDLEKKKKKHAVKVLLLSNSKEYQSYNRIRNPEQDLTGALAHYQPKDGLLVNPMKFRTSSNEDAEHKRREVIFHEGTHQLLDYYTGQNHLSSFGAMWSDEGVAEYFAGHFMDDAGTVHFGRMNHRISALEGMFGQSRRLPLRKFLKHTRYMTDKLKKEGKVNESRLLQNAVYAQGWALVYFMNNWHNGYYKKQFQAIMKKQIEDGDAGLVPFNWIFPKDDFDKLEVEFEDYLNHLATARKAGKISKEGVIADNDDKSDEG
ncbi:MAG: DUF1570 domain-containing protein [Planctomycetota bacterium]